MNFLSVRKLNSLGRSASISSSNVSLDGRRWSLSSSGSEDTVEDVGVHVDIDIEDGRINAAKTRTILRLEPVDENEDLICIRLSTNHHSFSLKRSVTIRTFNSFYYLQDTLKTLHPYLSVPSLPPKPILLFCSQQRKLQKFAKFLSEVLSERQYLSNKALHLFLQTNVSKEKIQQNLDGVRDDDVPKNLFVDRRCNSKNGFNLIFGDCLEHS